MTETRYYMVAEHLLGVEAADSLLSYMTNYNPFITDAANPDDALFHLTVTQDGPVSYIEEWRQDEDNQDTICGHTAQGDGFSTSYTSGQTAAKIAMNNIRKNK